MTPRRVDDDLLAVRAEQARGLTGLAAALGAEALVEVVLADLTSQWRTVRELPSTSRWARDRLARASLAVASGPPPGAEPDAARPLNAEPDDEARVFTAIRALPPTPRAAIVLTQVDGLAPAQVAEALGISAKAARAALDEAWSLLDAWLPAREPAPQPQHPIEQPRPAPPPDDDLFAPPWREPAR